MKLILSYIKRHISVFCLSTCFLTMEAMADLLQPTFMSHIVDEGVKTASVRKIVFYGIIMLGIACVGAISAVMRNIFASKTSQTIGKELRHDIYANVMTLSTENIDHLQPASIITRITNDVTQVQEFVQSLMRMMIKAPITCIGAIILIIVQTPAQAPIIAGVILICSALIYANIRVGYPRFGKVQRKLDKLNSVTRAYLSSVRVVKAFNAEDREEVKFEDASAELADANTTALRTMAVYSPLINLTVNFGIVVLLFISRAQDSSKIGRLMASVNYMSQVLFTVSRISNVINNAVRAIASSSRIKEILDERPAQRQSDVPQIPDARGALAFENVSFRYAGAGRETLNGITFAAEAGQTIGIIGPTGSGKTTLVNLAARFYDATTGRIVLDGCDIRDWDIAALRSTVAVVPQKALLFTGSIIENLRWGREDATESEITEAAKIACADAFVRETADGYNTLLGQGGINLSGGQKQRLALTRALLRKPKVLILDDCTSALDAQTESEVLCGLREHASETTVLLISQRISTVMKADRILVMDEGSVKGFGVHEDLIRDCGVYREIYRSQIGGNEHVGA